MSGEETFAAVVLGFFSGVIILGGIVAYFANNCHKRHTWWRILSKVFKYDYLYLEHLKENSALNGLARIHLDGNGEPYIKLIYKGKFQHIQPLAEILSEKLKKRYTTDDEKPAWKIIWLTCSKKKYFPMDDDEWLKKVKEVVEEC